MSTFSGSICILHPVIVQQFDLFFYSCMHGSGCFLTLWLLHMLHAGQLQQIITYDLLQCLNLENRILQSSLSTMGCEFCELVRARTRLQHKTEVAEKQLLHTEDDVRDLQMKAVEILSNVETLEMEIQQNKRCLNWYPNWGWRYRLSKKAMKKTLDISELLEKINKFGQPGRVGYRAPSTLPTIEFLCSKEFVVSESSMIAFHQIIEALQDDKISMIGLWGMGGVWAKPPWLEKLEIKPKS
ncbi:hypothetical protein PVK06_017773 [Gossypium arboreum]|uniref:Uncharacterized protein n=1 Tax=Gossypium arboreum TaxID=29729 RepID=A0ABR0Q3Z3_GOSAR|nr:hypothetical protein PVK06_017773 [Gossypium arboreum]